MALKQYAEAANALELSLKQNPHQSNVIEIVNELYNNHLKQPEKTKELPKRIEKIIVSGLPRSGTSMLMQMLSAGGLKVYSDDNRLPDEHNPKGYFEFQELTSPFDYPKLLSHKEFDVFNITYPLITELSHHMNFKVISMERDLQNVIYSQNKMKGAQSENLDFGLSAGLSQLRETCDRWLETQSNVSFLKLNYEDVLDNPTKEVEKVCQFLGVKLNVNSMLKSVEPKLNRSQL
jgi:hypothetical protein